MAESLRLAIAPKAGWDILLDLEAQGHENEDWIPSRFILSWFIFKQSTANG